MRVHTLRWTKKATNDLGDIIEYIDERNPVAAQKLETTLKQAAERLTWMPYLFRPGRVSGTRECVAHPNYILIYRVGDQTVDILSVLHAKQLYPKEDV